MTVDATTLTPPPVSSSLEITITGPTTDVNALLLHEIAATEVFRMAATRGGPDGSAHAFQGILQQVLEEHELAAEAFRLLLRDANAEPSDRSGAWGPWAPAVACVSDTGVTASPSLLDALLEGEQLLLEIYLTGAAQLSEIDQSFVTGQLVPAQQRHVRMLRALIGGNADE